MNHVSRCAAFCRPVAGLLLLVLTCFSFAHAAHAQGTPPFSKVVVFGDSLSDTGNVAHVVQSDFLIIRYPGPTFNYTDGRFTDGSDTTPAAQKYFGVWHEQLAKMLPSLTAATDSLDGGLDYAYGDATTQDGTSTVTYDGQSIVVENMGQQVTDYLTGPGAAGADPNALYILWGGADDLFTDATPANLVAAPARLAALAQRLAAAGAVNIVIPNLPPLGSTPAYVGDPPATIAGLNAATAFYNAQLAGDIATLQANLVTAGLHVRIYQLDISTLFQNVVANPANYGLTDIIDEAQKAASTVDPDTYLFWDDVHPTTSGHFNIATAAYSLLIPKVTLTILPAAPTPGEAVTLTAVVTSQPPATTPTGTVTFYSGTTEVGSGTLDGSGTATFTGSTLAAGTYVVTAVYSGDTNNLTSTSAPETVKIAAPSTTTLMLSATQVTVGAPVMLTATVADTSGVPTGTVSFLYGTIVVGTGTLNGSGVATFTGAASVAGTFPVSASYAGDSVYGPSVSVAQTVTVAAVGTTTTLTASPNPAGTGQAVLLTAKVAPVVGSGIPTGMVEFLDGMTSLGTPNLDGTGTATLSVTTLMAGDHPITASYSGDANYLGSTSTAVTETVAVPSIAFTANPTSLTITHGSSGTVTITGTPTAGFSGAATFACGTLPAHASCSFAPATLAFTGDATAQSTVLTIATKATTSSAVHPLDFGSHREGLLAVLCMPWLGMAGVAVFRRRRPGSGGIPTMLMLIVLSVVALAGMTACGSSSNTTAKGSYPVTVTVSGVGATTTLTVQLTVQ